MQPSRLVLGLEGFLLLLDREGGSGRLLTTDRSNTPTFVCLRTREAQLLALYVPRWTMSRPVARLVTRGPLSWVDMRRVVQKGWTRA